MGVNLLIYITLNREAFSPFQQYCTQLPFYSKYEMAFYLSDILSFFSLVSVLWPKRHLPIVYSKYSVSS